MNKSDFQYEQLISNKVFSKNILTKKLFTNFAISYLKIGNRIKNK